MATYSFIIPSARKRERVKQLVTSGGYALQVWGINGESRVLSQGEYIGSISTKTAFTDDSALAGVFGEILKKRNGEVR